MYQHIMVPIDGSKQSLLAFKKAVCLAKQTQASLLLVHIIDTRNYQSILTYDASLAKESKEESEKQMTDCYHYAKEQGIQNIETVIKFGSPREEICYHLPEKYHIDYIMMGATGLNVVERLLLGSVSDYVTRYAPCDVTIVRTK